MTTSFVVDEPVAVPISLELTRLPLWVQQILVIPARNDLSRDRDLAEASRKAITSTGRAGSEVFRCAERGDLGCLLLFLQAGTNVDVTNNEGETLLVRAVVGRSVEAVRVLVMAEADLNKRDARGRTALMLAAVVGDEPIARALAEAGANLEAKDRRDDTALTKAAREGKLEVVRALVEAGANIDAVDDETGSTVLMQALEHPDIVELLARTGADVDAQDDDGLTALMIAVAISSESVRTLLRHGPDLGIRNNDRLTVLEYARRRANAETGRQRVEANNSVSYLLESSL